MGAAVYFTAKQTCAMADSQKHTFTSAFEGNDGAADDDDREGGRGGRRRRSGKRMTRWVRSYCGFTCDALIL